MPPGDYTVTVAYVGFAPFTKSIKVTAAQVAGVDAVLQVASRTEQVLVTAERVRLNATTAARHVSSKPFYSSETIDGASGLV